MSWSFPTLSHSDSTPRLCGCGRQLPTRQFVDLRPLNRPGVEYRCAVCVETMVRKGELSLVALAEAHNCPPEDISRFELKQDRLNREGNPQRKSNYRESSITEGVT